MGGSGPFGEGSGAPTPLAVENFRMLQDRQTSDTTVDVSSTRGRVNLLNWDGRGRPEGLFPRDGTQAADETPDDTAADAPAGQEDAPR